MAVVEVHKGDIGTTFMVTIKDENDTVKDISAYTTRQLLFRKPDGSTVLTKTASFYTDGTDGKIYYTTVSGDLDTVGIWRLQAYLHNGSTNYRKSNVGTFSVFDNLA